MNSTAEPKDWIGQSIAALSGLTRERLPGAELLFLDGLAVYLMGPDAPQPPYTVEHGTVAAGHLLRAFAAGPEVKLAVTLDGKGVAAARAAIVHGGRAFAQRGGPGIQHLVRRFIAAAAGELEVHRESPEGQTRSLFYYGLLAVASGPENRMTPAAADGVADIFRGWNDQIGAGFVPPWRIVAPSPS